MKKTIIVLLCFLFSFCVFAGCEQAEESKTDISANDVSIETSQKEEASDAVSDTVSDAVSDAESQETSTPQPEASEQENETSDNSGEESVSEERTFVIVDKRSEQGVWSDMLDTFYTDDVFMYYFGSYPQHEYIIVEYSDGTTQNIKQALEDGNITVMDLDIYGIDYLKYPKSGIPENPEIGEDETFVIIDKRGEMSSWENVRDIFFEDDGYTYFFRTTPEHEYVIVEYADGTAQNVKEAFKSGKITMEDLDRFSIVYFKIPTDKTK